MKLAKLKYAVVSGLGFLLGASFMGGKNDEVHVLDTSSDLDWNTLVGGKTVYANNEDDSPAPTDGGVGDVGGGATSGDISSTTCQNGYTTYTNNTTGSTDRMPNDMQGPPYVP